MLSGRRGLTLGLLVVALIAAAPASASMQVANQWFGTLLGFNQPFGTAFDSSGKFYVVNRGANSISILTPTGAWLSDWNGHTLASDPTFSTPFTVDFGPTGDIYVGDAGNRILQYTAGGTFIRTWGKGVDQITSANVCTATSGDVCGTGTSGTGAGEFNGPRSLAVDGSGNVYVVDGNNNRIEKFDSSGSFVSAWGKDVGGTGVNVCTLAANCQAGAQDSSAGGFWAPEGVAVDAAGNVYVADAANNRIQKFDGGGTFLRMWGKGVGGAGVNTCTSSCQASSVGTAEGEFSRPTSISFDGSGNFFVLEHDNLRVDEFDSAGSFLRMWGHDVGGSGVDTCTSSCQASTSGTAAGQFNNPVTVDAGPDGVVYVSEFTNQRIQAFDSSGTFIRAQGYEVDTSLANVCTSTCQGANGVYANDPFDDPEDITRDGSGNLYVPDFNTNEIHVFDAQGRSVRVFGYGGADAGALAGPEGVAVAPLGNIYVADYNNNRVDQFTPTGTFIRTWGKDVDQTNPANVCTGGLDTCQAGTAGGGHGEFDRPSGVAVDSNGNVYVVDINDRIQKFDPSGNFVAQIGSTGSGAGQLNFPWKIVVDSADNLWVSELDNDRVSVFSSSGSFLRSYPGFTSPTGVAVDGAGNFFVADAQLNHVQMFRASGSLVKTWGTTGSGDGQLKAPNGLALGSGGDVYVADSINHRIQVFSESDATPPQTTIDSGPSGDTTATSPSFGFSSSEPAGALFECSFDGSAFAPCTSPYATGPLAIGSSHTFSVRAIDAAGNQDPTPASSAFTVVTASAGGDGTPTSSGSSSTTPPASSPGTTPTPASPAEIAAALSSNVTKVGRALVKLRLSGLLRKRGATVTLKSVTAGKLQITVRVKKVVVLTGARAFTAAGSAGVRLKLTPAGKRLLKRLRVKTVFAVSGTFSGGGVKPASATRKFSVKPR